MPAQCLPVHHKRVWAKNQIKIIIGIWPQRHEDNHKNVKKKYFFRRWHRTGEKAKCIFHSIYVIDSMELISLLHLIRMVANQARSQHILFMRTDIHFHA